MTGCCYYCKDEGHFRADRPKLLAKKAREAFKPVANVCQQNVMVSS